jgi:hypothetical protein
MPKLAAEELYRRIGRLFESMPNLEVVSPLSGEQMQWFARATALVEASGDSSAGTNMRMATGDLLTANAVQASQKALMILYKVFADAELQAPPGVQGTFIPVGKFFDAFSALTGILRSAKTDVLVVDPYMDESFLTDFAGSIPNGVALRIMSDKEHVKPPFKTAATRWMQQNPGALQARLAPRRTLHDRAIFIDAKAAWTLTQSIKDFVKRSPAEIVRVDDIAPLKIAAYEDIWKNSEVVQ